MSPETVHFYEFGPYRLDPGASTASIATALLVHEQSLCSGSGAGGPAMQGIALRYS